ncbi:hypothetical protein ACLI1C_18995 [Devosia sp. XGJD_8]|uniref:hypothetical protein n=1 Tax=Devosia sp. XGJD_8 TaxID=3391187 RepID=UPI00398537DD
MLGKRQFASLFCAFAFAAVFSCSAHPQANENSAATESLIAAANTVDTGEQLNDERFGEVLTCSVVFDIAAKRPELAHQADFFADLSVHMFNLALERGKALGANDGEMRVVFFRINNVLRAQFSGPEKFPNMKLCTDLADAEFAHMNQADARYESEAITADDDQHVVETNVPIETKKADSPASNATVPDAEDVPADLAAPVSEVPVATNDPALVETPQKDVFDFGQHQLTAKYDRAVCGFRLLRHVVSHGTEAMIGYGTFVVDGPYLSQVRGTWLTNANASQQGFETAKMAFVSGGSIVGSFQIYALFDDGTGDTELPSMAQLDGTGTLGSELPNGAVGFQVDAGKVIVNMIIEGCSAS